MKLTVHTQSDTGNVRLNNEDAIGYDVNPQLGFLWMVIADGMGGHKAGEVASAMLVDEVRQRCDELTEVPEMGWQSWLSETLQQAHKLIREKAQKDSDCEGMGTTGVVAICYQNKLMVAWVGDSRAYQFSAKKLKQLTVDHTMIQYLLDKGAITQKEAEESNTKNILSRAIGVKDKVAVDYAESELAASDYILLTTDGVHDYLGLSNLKSFIEESDSIESLARTCIESASQNGSKDNLTIGVISVSG